MLQIQKYDISCFVYFSVFFNAELLYYQPLPSFIFSAYYSSLRFIFEASLLSITSLLIGCRGWEDFPISSSQKVLLTGVFTNFFVRDCLSPSLSLRSFSHLQVISRSFFQSEMSSSGENKPVLYTFWASSCAWRVRIALKVRYKHFVPFQPLITLEVQLSHEPTCPSVGCLVGWLAPWLIRRRSVTIQAGSYTSMQSEQSYLIVALAGVFFTNILQYKN